MKQVVLDTHALIWHLTAPKRLGKAAHRAMTQVDAGKAIAIIPAIVAVELALIREAGRRVPGPPELESLVKQHPGFRIQSIDLAHAIEFMLLGSLKDPFDRLIVATARVSGIPLLTADERITNSSLIQTIWD
ncbi:MAG: type II toxin-antitoxin system VapC family toxin [Myxococcota bacterium]